MLVHLQLRVMESAVTDIPETAIQDDEYIQIGSFGYRRNQLLADYALALNDQCLLGANLVGINHEIGTVNAKYQYGSRGIN